MTCAENVVSYRSGAGRRWILAGLAVLVLTGCNDARQSGYATGLEPFGYIQNGVCRSCLEMNCDEVPGVGLGGFTRCNADTDCGATLACRDDCSDPQCVLDCPRDPTEGTTRTLGCGSDRCRTCDIGARWDCVDRFSWTEPVASNPLEPAFVVVPTNELSDGNVGGFDARICPRAEPDCPNAASLGEGRVEAVLGEEAGTAMAQITLTDLPPPGGDVFLELNRDRENPWVIPTLAFWSHPLLGVRQSGYTAGEFAGHLVRVMSLDSYAIACATATETACDASTGVLLGIPSACDMLKAPGIEITVRSRANGTSFPVTYWDGDEKAPWAESTTLPNCQFTAARLPAGDYDVSGRVRGKEAIVTEDTVFIRPGFLTLLNSRPRGR